MRISTITAIQILLFNLAFLLVYQPRFLFYFFKMAPSTERTVKIVLTSLGIVTICILFGWSFYFGATLYLYKQSVLN